MWIKSIKGNGGKIGGKESLYATTRQVGQRFKQDGACGSQRRCCHETGDSIMKICGYLDSSKIWRLILNLVGKARPTFDRFNSDEGYDMGLHGIQRRDQPAKASGRLGLCGIAIEVLKQEINIGIVLQSRMTAWRAGFFTSKPHWRRLAGKMHETEVVIQSNTVGAGLGIIRNSSSETAVKQEKEIELSGRESKRIRLFYRYSALLHWLHFSDFTNRRENQKQHQQQYPYSIWHIEAKD